MAKKKRISKTKNLARKRVAVKGSKKKKTQKDMINEITVRMYCHGFGDCFLLTFQENSEPRYRMLIDCGMLTGDTDRLKTVIADIKSGGKLDLVVQTHEHKDHISGFNLKGSDGKLLWDDIDVDSVWMAWTEDTGKDGDKLAKQLKKKQNKKKFALARAIGLFDNAIEDLGYKNMLEKQSLGMDYRAAQQRYSQALKQVVNFYGIGSQEIQQAMGGEDFNLTMKDAMSYFQERNERIPNKKAHISFRSPGQLSDSTTTGLPGIRFYILGPPKNYDQLRRMEDQAHVEMYMSDMGFPDNFLHALSNGNGEEEEQGKNDKPWQKSPFAEKYVIKREIMEEMMNAGTLDEYSEAVNIEYIERAKRAKASRTLFENPLLFMYYNAGYKWRQIETDSLHNAGILALNLDSYTNNTSLVIAIEFEKSGKVLLFPADAQIGNWLSWTEPVSDGKSEPKLKWEVERNGKTETVTAAKLLERTVFYKVGHHASHNATARAHGLELMKEENLVAMIPVDEQVAKKQGKRGWKMPAKDLYTRLIEKTRGRIIRLDEGNILENGVDEIPAGVLPTKKQLEDFNSRIVKSQKLVTSDDGVKRPLYIEYRISSNT